MLRSGELQGFRWGRSFRISAEEVARIEGGAKVEPVIESRQPVLHLPFADRVSDWPAAMKAKTAAAYLDMSEAAFLREVAALRLPPSFMLGGRPHWLRSAIDAALDLLAGSKQMSDAQARFWAKSKTPND